MTRPILPSNFATQSYIAIAVEGVAIRDRLPIDGGRGLALTIEGAGRATVRVTGLLAGRFYRMDGAAHGFVRADPEGGAAIALTTAGSTLLALWPVI